MGRLTRGLALWVAGTAIAVSLAWLGAEVVLKDAAPSGPQPPVLNAASPAPSMGVAPSKRPSPTPAGSRPPRLRPSPAGLPPSPGATPPATQPAPNGPAPGTIHSYALTGGRVTLQFGPSSIQLVTATPAAGFSVQTWSAPGWLRVDFSQGAAISSLIATWNSGAPTIQTFTDG
jgi:hypothetical protein